MSEYDWTVVIRGDWHLPHLVNMLNAYTGNREQTSCRDEVVAQIKAQYVGGADGLDVATGPVVVIDPDDRDTVVRLIEAVDLACDRRQGVGGPSIDDFQAALRSLIAPPKPDEPGRYGVIEDADGWEWCRIDSGSEGYTWQRLGQPSTTPPTYATWAGLNAVKVLSQGVTS